MSQELQVSMKLHVKSLYAKVTSCKLQMKHGTAIP